MSKVIMLIAQGANDFEIPCRVMPNIDAAYEFCKELGLEPIGDSGMRYALPDLDENKELAKKIFTSYYGGCGEAYAIMIQEVKFNEAFIGWDLD